MKRILLVLVCVCCGCGPSLIVVNPRVDTRHTYTIDDVGYARAGNNMIEVARVYTLPTFVSRDSPDTLYYARSRNSDGQRQVWVAAYRLDGKIGYVLVNDPAASYGIHVRNGGYIDQGNVRLPGGKRGDVEAWPEANPPFKPVSAVLLPGSFQAALEYSGRQDSVIHLVYREYHDGVMQPVHKQELAFDLNASPLIHFKSLTIEIIEATPTRIQFRVLEDGGLPWLPPAPRR